MGEDGSSDDEERNWYILLLLIGNAEDLVRLTF